MKITVEWLKEHDACPREIRKFKRIFPDGARLTKTNLLKAARSGLNIEFVYWRSVPLSQWVKYETQTRELFESLYNGKKPGTFYQAAVPILWPLLKEMKWKSKY